MYPIYATIIRLVFFAILLLLVIFGSYKIYNLNDVIKKLFAIAFLIVFIGATMYITFFKGNVHKWEYNDSKILTERILSIAGADLNNYDDNFNENSDSQRPIIYISKQSTQLVNDKQETKKDFLNDKTKKKKCLFFSDNNYSILIEPVVGTRFFTTPTGMYESDIHVFAKNEYIRLHIIESQKYTFLQPLMFTSPKVENIYDLLNCAEIRKELQ